MTVKTALLCAGGTGGHLFPAEALAHELKARGWNVHLATDRRAVRFAGQFPADELHEISSATIGSRNPLSLMRAGLTIWKGVRQSRKLIRTIKADVVIGFGGYPTLPPLYAATRLGVPTIIHEQNAVMGRANKAMAPRVQAIAGGFLAKDGPFADKIVITGNPLRPDVLRAAQRPYVPSGPNEPFNLLVFGGSQGARAFAELVPHALALMSPAQSNRIRLVQQVRLEDETELREAYRALGMNVEIASFFTDMAERIAQAHFIMSRSGASTVAEISAIGRPALLVPFPHALDHDQAANAAALERAGGAEIIPQSKLTADRLRGMLEAAMAMPEKLATMAHSAKALGHPDAAQLLAGLVEGIAAGGTPEEFTRRHDI